MLIFWSAWEYPTCVFGCTYMFFVKPTCTVEEREGKSLTLTKRKERKKSAFASKAWMINGEGRRVTWLIPRIYFCHLITMMADGFKLSRRKNQK